VKILGRYINGNFRTTIFDDGTVVRETEENEFIPSFASNMDIKISNYCDMGCKFCHEGSTKNGKHGDILNAKFVDTLHPHQEVALGGGDVTSHPDLIPFLHKLRDRRVISNITVNQRHFEQKQELIKKLVDEKLIYGLGVSLVNPTDEFISLIQQYPNRRGGDWYSEDYENITTKQMWLKENLERIIEHFKVVSFDNLAIDQLEVKRLMNQEEWEEFYMGDDSEFTYFIDMVKKKFSKNSTTPLNERFDLLGSVDDMFQKIRLRK